MKVKEVNLRLQRDPAGRSGKFKRSGWGVRAAKTSKEQNKTRHFRQDLNTCKNADGVPLYSNDDGST